jgi:hypothetical protein
MADEWDEALKRFDARTVKRRERAKEHDQKAQEIYPTSRGATRQRKTK